ncbi:fluoride efflux transporter CrcB [Hyphomicrobium sp.]|uniref:fluoride efflux transporter CrcB n=1 Tax=Hyphomicrobium sp. TaxID=82 RepID=UPI002CD2BB8F|nr:fluoride efflux transporter CrcB [Hyphomicrobium sp.]HRN89423.1 fluoride efflux transporter CrcB [Hyphomicrobium sp.]HRQ27284.1 fluoride efflux transporter CrcB [Hyphomicrobium sp.]
MHTSVIVFIGAGLGGLLRHIMNSAITGLTGAGFPYGILTINVLGSTAMGLLAGWLAFRGEAPAELRLFLATGLLGGFTTFSAFSMDTALLIERGETGLAAIYVGTSVALSVIGLFAGLWAMRAVLS